MFVQILKPILPKFLEFNTVWIVFGGFIIKQLQYSKKDKNSKTRIRLYGKRATQEDILSEIHKLLFAKGERSYSLKPREIAEILGFSYKTVYNYISKLSKTGKVSRVGSGHYHFPKPVILFVKPVVTTNLNSTCLSDHLLFWFCKYFVITHFFCNYMNMGQ